MSQENANLTQELLNNFGSETEIGNILEDNYFNGINES